MNNVIDFDKEKNDRDQPSLDDVICGLTSNNCDTNRPYIEQQPLRAKMIIKGLTRRDISDCMVLGILTCKEGCDLPMIYVSEKGNKFKSWKDFEKSQEVCSESYIDPERVTYEDLYGWNLNKIDPIAAIQNMACFLERRMGVFPALLDGVLTEGNKQ